MVHKTEISHIEAFILGQRGSLYRYPELVGPRTALVVVDLQNGFMLPGMPLEVPYTREIVPTVNRLAAATRAVGGTVVWVQMTLDGERERWSVFFDADQLSVTESSLRRDSEGYQLYEELDAKPSDLYVEKTRYSAFIQGSSELDEQLRKRGIDTLIITGVATNGCCEATARDAMMLNYKVIFVSDANATLSDEAHNATLATILPLYGDVYDAEEAISRLVRTPKESRVEAQALSGEPVAAP